MTPDPARVQRGKRSQIRAKTYESDIAKRLGGTRHPANTGGPEDVEHSVFCVQVKSGKMVVTQVIRDGMAAATAASAGTDKLPALVLVDRRTARLQRYIMFDLDAFAAHYSALSIRVP